MGRSEREVISGGRLPEWPGPREFFGWNEESILQLCLTEHTQLSSSSGRSGDSRIDPNSAMTRFVGVAF